jgi:hypothetical protein
MQLRCQLRNLSTGQSGELVLACIHMQPNHPEISAAIESTARREGGLDFKDEGETEVGLPFGPLTLKSSGVFPKGRWVTKRQALRIAQAWGVELFEY